MTGWIRLFGSKRGVWCVLVLAMAFALVILGHLSGADWAALAKWVTGFLVAGHTASSLADKMQKPALPVATASAPDAKPPA
jgi:hypothetical protein